MLETPIKDSEFITLLFEEGLTVREIAQITGSDPYHVLLFLTKQKHWSKYCGSCKLRQCYDCPKFTKLGRLDIQDRIDLIAQRERE